MTGRAPSPSDPWQRKTGNYCAQMVGSQGDSGYDIFGTPRHSRTVPDAHPTVTHPGSPRGKNRKFSFSSSPSTSITALPCFATEGSLCDELIVEPGSVTLHGTFYRDDGSVEVICSMTLLRVHTSTLPFHSPVLHQTFAPTNLTAAEFPNGYPRIASFGTPADYTTLLKAIYLPG